MNWDLPNPYCMPLSITAEAIDHYGHVNNVEYLRYIEKVSWHHSQQLGLSLDDYQAMDRALVVVRHELDYQAPAYEGDELLMATWIISCDQRMSLVRRFQLLRPADGKTLFRGMTRFACVALSSHRPRRLPDKFLQVYMPALIEEKPAKS